MIKNILINTESDSKALYLVPFKSSNTPISHNISSLLEILHEIKVSESLLMSETVQNKNLEIRDRLSDR